MQNNLKRCSQREWEKESQHALTAVESTPSKHKRFRLFNLKNYGKMFNIKIVWFIIMHDVQQKLSTFLILHFIT
jgi:hypothetical protein